MTPTSETGQQMCTLLTSLCLYISQGQGSRPSIMCSLLNYHSQDNPTGMPRGSSPSHSGFCPVDSQHRPPHCPTLSWSHKRLLGSLLLCIPHLLGCSVLIPPRSFLKPPAITYLPSNQDYQGMGRRGTGVSTHSSLQDFLNISTAAKVMLLPL